MKYIKVIAALLLIITHECVSAQSVYDRLNMGRDKKSSKQKETKDTLPRDRSEAGDYIETDVSKTKHDGYLNGIPFVRDENMMDNDKAIGGKESLRKDAAIEFDTTINSPLEYEKLHEKDVIFRARIWRDIDAYSEKNRSYFLRNDYFDETGNERLIGVILNALKGDAINEPVQAFSNTDDRFTTPVSFEEALQGFGGGVDTAASYDEDGNIDSYKIMNREVNLDSVTKFRIKEEWIFNKRTGRMYIRILGIAPLSEYKNSDGYTYQNSLAPVFWVYYPDLRKALVNVKVNDPLNVGNTINWEEVFENRLFESNIIKSSLDNELGVKQYPLTQEQSKAVEKLLIDYKRRLYEKY